MSNTRMPPPMRVLSSFILLILALSLVTLFVPGLVKRTSAVESIDVGVYWDIGCTQEVTSIDWGQLTPGSIASYQFFAKNEKVDHPIHLGLYTRDWAPSQAENYITLSWDYNEKSINPEDKRQITLTLSVSENIREIADFSFNIFIAGSEYMFGDLDHDGYIGIADIVAVTELFGTTSDNPRWDPLADLNFNNMIGIDDLVKLVEKYSTFSI